jgi:hypothetical protein
VEEGLKDGIEEGADLAVKVKVGQEKVLDRGLMMRPVEVLVFSCGLRRSA